MRTATKQSDGTYDRFDEHLESGDRVLREEIFDKKREYTFLEVTDDGQVRFKDAFGRERETMASMWQIEWENGDLEIPDGGPDLGDLPVVSDADRTEQVDEIRRHYRSYQSGVRVAGGGCRTSVDGERIRIDFDKLSDRDLEELTTAIYLGSTSWVLANQAVSRCKWDDLTEVSGVTERHAEALRASGYETLDDLKAADQGELAEVARVGNALAARIQADVGGLQVDDEPDDEDRDERSGLRATRGPIFHGVDSRISSSTISGGSSYIPMHTMDPKGDDDHDTPFGTMLEDHYERAKESDEPNPLINPFNFSLADEDEDTEGDDEADEAPSEPELSEYGRMFEDAMQEFEADMGRPPENFGLALLWATVAVDWGSEL